VDPLAAGLWENAVFHVLAHVRATRDLASSVYDPAYVALVEESVGPARDRTLEEDAHLLGQALPSFDALARVQALAWLFRSEARVRSACGRDLAALAPEDVDAPALLPALAGDPAAEILRAAAELEMPLLPRLPPLAMDLGELGRALDVAALAAPLLRACRVFVVRALGLRGRVMGREVWIGDAPPEHAAWQAAHEATVAEIGKGEHAAVEGAALVLLARRAGEAGLGEAHARWLSHLGEEMVASVAEARRASRSRT
jgi:hypothetical protein